MSKIVNKQSVNILENNTDSGDGEVINNEVDYIVKFLESLPLQAQAKALAELKTRFNFDKTKEDAVQSNAGDQENITASGKTEKISTASGKTEKISTITTKRKVKSTVTTKLKANSSDRQKPRDISSDKTVEILTTTTKRKVKSTVTTKLKANSSDRQKPSENSDKTAEISTTEVKRKEKSTLNTKLKSNSSAKTKPGENSNGQPIAKVSTLKNNNIISKATTKNKEDPKELLSVSHNGGPAISNKSFQKPIRQQRKSSRVADKVSIISNKPSAINNELGLTQEEVILPHSPFIIYEADENTNQDIEELTPEIIESRLPNHDSQSKTSSAKESNKVLISEPYMRPKKRKLNVLSKEPKTEYEDEADPKLASGCYVSIEKLILHENPCQQNTKKIKINKKSVKRKKQKVVSDEEYIDKKAKRKNYCEICDKQYQSRNGWVNHVFSHTGESPHSCKYCGKKFSLKSALDLHVRRHENYKPFECALCDYKSVGKIDVLKHMAVHTGNKKFFCNFCGKPFVNKSRLTTHVKVVHNDGSEENEICHICGFIVKSKYNLQRHLKVMHTDQETFQCPICEKVIVQKHVFKLHLEMHTGVMPFNCKVCQKRFPNKTRLYLHEKTHEKANLACSHCNRKFKTHCHLKRHTIIHTTDKPFKCKLCPYSCNVNGNLIKHIRMVHNLVDFKKRKSAVSVINENSNPNEKLLEKGFNLLEEVLKKTTIVAGKEFTLEELKQMDLEHQERKRLTDMAKRPALYNVKRKRGRPKKPVAMRPPNLKPPVTISLRKLVEGSITSPGNPKVLIETIVRAAEPNSGGIVVNQYIPEVNDGVDFNQYIFEVENESVELPIEIDEEEKEIMVNIIEVMNDDEAEDMEECGPRPEELLVIDEDSLVLGEAINNLLDSINNT